jgi:hypothetical protein
MAAGQPVTTCAVANDPQQRQWTLERPTSGAPDAPWRIVFKSRALKQARAELRVPHAQPLVTRDAVTLSFHSANGGLTIDWKASPGPSTLDLYVNFGLEVNVDADLDPAVEQMNTQGPLSVMCTLSPALAHDPPSLVLVRRASYGAAGWVGTLGTAGTRGTAGTVDTQGTPGTLGTMSSEWVIGAGAAWGIRIFHSKGDRWYAMQTVSWGRELTRDLGPGVFRGRFVWAIEGMPIFAQAHPTHVYGVGVAPVLWRWNFVPRPRWSAFGELAMGGLWTSAPVPERTQQVNFTAHWGAGVRLHRSRNRSIVLAYRLQHISNGNLSTNPGVNSHVVFAGWSIR